MVLNGTTGARLRIAFPIISRASFGFWLSYFAVVSRVVLSLFWYGVLVCMPLYICPFPHLVVVLPSYQTFTGSECVYQMLKAIWPSISHVPNHLSPKANITTVGKYSLVLFTSNLIDSIRYYVLLPLLAYPISLHVGVSTKDPAPFHCKNDHRTDCMGGHAHLGAHQGPSRGGFGISALPT